MRCAGAISGPAVRQFALAQRQSGRRGCLLASVLQDASIIDSALALFALQTQPKPAASGSRYYPVHPWSWVPQPPACFGALPWVVYM